MPTRHVVAAAVALALAGSAVGASLPGAPAAAADRSKPTVAVVAKKLVGPLSVAQAPDGTRYWADVFAGTLYKETTAGVVSVIYKSKHHGPQSVSADGGVLRFTSGSTDNKAGGVWTLGTNGAPVELADTWAFEKANNPDGRYEYGIRGISRTCASQLPKQATPAYHGIRETHAYSVASGNGVTYVADAGANDILALDASGTLRLVAAIKPLNVTITKAAATAEGLPDCTVGKKYGLEAVPTDVEYGPDGMLYVTSLPGGPDDGSLGNNGRVLRIDPATGKVTTLVSGLVSPTGVAVAANGDVYVAQLYAGQISRIPAGSHKVEKYADVPFPAAVEVTPTGLLATANSVPMTNKPKGEVITLTP